jgi:hypothetical protein
MFARLEIYIYIYRYIYDKGETERERERCFCAYHRDTEMQKVENTFWADERIAFSKKWPSKETSPNPK